MHSTTGGNMSQKTISEQLKAALITAGMSATLAIISANAWASDAKSYEDKQVGNRSSHHEKEDRGSKHHDRMVKKVSELKSELNLRADQANVWEAFAQAMVKKEDHKEHDRKAQKEQFKTMNTLERLDWMQTKSSQRAESMGQRNAAIRQFYGALDAQQKTKFDEVFWSRMGPRHDKGHD